jgi:hypothetical protein
MELRKEVVLSVVIKNSVPLSKQLNDKREEGIQRGFSNCGTGTITDTPTIV